jgi:hypothetical protein
MSSEVQAKWTNSAPGPKPMPASLSFKWYSTALTSWLVRRSMALMAATSSASKSRTHPRRTSAVPSGTGGSSAISGRAARVSNHSISTARRWRMRASSENASANSVSWAA